MKTKIAKYILILVAMSTFMGPSTAYAQVQTNYWKYVSGFLQPIVDTWKVMFKYSSSTEYSSFKVASSTNWYGGGLTTCSDATSALTWSGGFFGCHTITASGGSGIGTISTSTSPTIGNLSFWTSKDAWPEKLGSVATTSLTISSPLTTSGTAGALVGGTNLTVGLDTTGTWSGNAGTASALAANGANCTAGQGAGGVSASGVAEDCVDFITGAEVPSNETDSAHDTCAEISGCVVGAITGNQSITLSGDVAGSGTTAITTSIGNEKVLGRNIATSSQMTDQDIVVWNSATDDFAGKTCTEITGSADLCDGNDATGGAGGGADFTYATDIGYGITGSATTTKTQFTLGIHASSTSYFSNATSTLFTAITGWFTNLWIGADTLAEYIADTAGAFFTGNTETGITVTYQDADNTVDVVCDTANTSTFGCLTDTDWDTFNGKADLGSAMTGTFDGIDFTGGALAQNALWVGGAGATPSELALGTGGYILGVSGGTPAWIATTTIPLAGDVTGTLSATVVGNDSHTHDATTISGLGTDDISGLDISADTNLTAGDHLTLTDDDIDLDTEIKTQIKSIVVSASSEITATTTVAQMMFPTAITITRVSCSTDVGTAVIQGDERAAATPNTGGTDVLTSTLTCDSDEQATTSFANASIASRVPLNFDIDSVATAPRRLRINVEFTIND